MLTLEVFGAIINNKDRRNMFVSAFSSENVLREIVDTDAVLGSLTCIEDHKLADNVVSSVARSLFHVFYENVISKSNRIQRGDTGKRPAEYAS